ncbi:LANO_0H12398g1_1 [Lachancea nothofagi CBS 11611]|uniref:Histone-lysine N-methyltransferase, H3 lysine-79 specific n=1 Tax=Lachancea nothofagi CBS 11611 TaxID=1266666 RepID=A0A1G4KMD2_9SACH|nr:LANO_0H12398g1_1 [Lachancea nothofagi CBS 11611]
MSMLMLHVNKLEPSNLDHPKNNKTSATVVVILQMAYESISAAESLMSEASRSSTAETSSKSDDDGIVTKKKARVNKSLLSLLNDACRYSAYDEFSMPDAFLRRKGRRAATIKQETSFSKTNKKANGTIEKVAETQVVVKARLAKKTNTAGTKKKSKDVIGSIKVRKPRRNISRVGYAENSDEEEDNKTPDLNSKVPKASKLPKGKIRKSRSPRISNTKELQKDQITNQIRPGSKQAKTRHPESFVSNWDFHFTRMPYSFNLPGPDASDKFTEELVHSCKINRSKSVQKSVVKLQYILYPTYQEEFVVDFKADSSRYNSMSEIGRIIEFTSLVYLPPKYLPRMQSRVIKPLNKAFDEELQEQFIRIIEIYNDFIKNIPQQEVVEQLKSLDKIPTSLLHSILHMVYVRTIHPKAGSLRKYQAFSNNVYGELLPQFLTTAYEQCNLGTDHIFMDLGSGVGNCVFQAALEFGCQLSFGCELMPHASTLTEAQERELRNRCRLYGFNLGPTQFSLRQSFVDNPAVQGLLPKCDVLLINNFIFDAKLNELVRKLIQPLKVGCKIISLKSLRPCGYTIDYDNADNILNRLKVERFDLMEDSVSWTHRGGEYYISTVQEEIDEMIFTTHSKGRTRARRIVKYTK